MTGNGILLRRLINIGVAGLVGAVLIGLCAPNPALLIAGLLALGIGLILALQFYLLRPVEGPFEADTFDVSPDAYYDEELDLRAVLPRSVASSTRRADVIQLEDWKRREPQ